ncbi:NAD(P)H-hydrate epimerase [Erythrobacter litoralis]|uniref:NAD(P)H-hydrate epimerase n=1 Tax=Erythrobacter litoralis TaxID=39960 RepID=UPI002435A3DA|nr:NAD(P)H-hydrate epimerase [Erythrobacter litoralis]MDG6078282.1 NAD(P)H-hydrate epimerase [Erythrobacter litoralis]
MSNAVLSVAEMRAAERAATADGVSEWDLMRRAGEGAAEWVRRMAAGRAVTVLCGPGNNGGDGYVIAQTLAIGGTKVRVVAPELPNTDLSKKARALYEGTVERDGDLSDPVIVDCLFGYGLSRAVEGPYAQLLEQLSNMDAYRIAVDVPSGVVADSGQLLGTVPQFDLTLALGAWKPAHFTIPARQYMGTTRLVPIGIDTKDTFKRSSSRPKFQVPQADSQKYIRGLLAIAAGEMPSASLLSAEAAMRAGAGYVKLISEHSHPAAPADLVVDEMELAEALNDRRIDACLIGPGLGRSSLSRDRLSAVLDQGMPTVLDADALHLIDSDTLEGLDATKLVCTPHEGELAALCNTFDIRDEGKANRARALHAKTGMTVLAKGPDTILVGEDGMRYFPAATPWLSVAGSGDVLAGIIAARLAMDGDPFQAAEEGFWLHAEAARLAAPAFTASELTHCVGSAMRAFL